MAEDDTDMLSNIWYNVGNLYITLGDTEMAKQSFNLSVMNNP